MIKVPPPGRAFVMMREQYYDYELIEPWTEPKSGEVWVNINENGDLTASSNPALLNKSKPIACIKVKWTEGQFDE